MRASRRIVTVLFADLVGFTSLSEVLDAEDVAAIQSAYFDRAREAIVRHGGVVEKYIGDAVVGSFGAPEAHDSDAEHAVRAALDVVSAVQEIGRDLGPVPAELQVRVGVNTGEVLITQRAPGDWQLTGDVVNVAARLQSAAGPGTVLVGPETALAVDAAMELEPAGALSVKGKSAAVDGWYVVGVRATPRAPLLGTGAILGREPEVELLVDSWRDAVGPVGWLVTAPPGVGKTRLVRELRSRLTSGGVPVWWTAAREDDPTGYQCVAELLRQSLGADADPGSVRDLVLGHRSFHDAADLEGEVVASHTRALLAGDPLDAEPADLYASWTAVLDGHGSMLTPVWVVEDLHLAGPDLLAFLRAASTGLAGPSRLLVATSRPTDAVEQLRHGTGLHSLHLDPLPLAATIGIIEQVVGRDVVPRPVLDAVGRAAGGNPLFIEELLRSWIHAGVLQPAVGGGWRFVHREGADRLPTTVQSLYLGQLDGLPDHSRQVVSSASVPGHTFPAAALSVLDVSEADPALEQLTDYGLLVGPHPGDMDGRSYTYRHGLLREVAYASLPRRDRSRLHVRFARWLQTLSDGARDEVVGEHLAAAYENLSRLGDPPEEGLTREALGEHAGALLERSAEQHVSSAPARAAYLLERSLRLNRQPAPEVLLRRTLRLGDAQRRAGRLEAALRTLARAGKAAVEAGSVTGQVQAALGYEEALYASRFPRQRWGSEGMALLHAALAAVPDDDEETQALLAAALGRAQLYGGDEPRGLETCQRAVDLARRSGSPKALAQALLATRAGQWEPHHLPERLRALDMVVEAAGQAGDGEHELEAARLQFVDALEAGDVTASDAALERADRLVRRLGRPLYFWYPSMWAAMRALMHGPTSQAEAAVHEFREQGSRWLYPDVLRVHVVQLLELRTQQGVPARVLPTLRAVVGEDPARWAATVAAAYTRVGELDEAAQLLDVQAHQEFTEVPRDLSWTYNMALLAETADAVGDRSASAVLAELLRPWEGHAVVLGSGALCLGSVSHYAGLAARTAGDLERAVRCFTEAVAFNDRIGARWAATRSRAELTNATEAPR